MTTKTAVLEAVLRIELIFLKLCKMIDKLRLSVKLNREISNRFPTKKTFSISCHRLKLNDEKIEIEKNTSLLFHSTPFGFR